MREETLEADNKMAKIQKVMLTMLRDDFLSVHTGCCGSGSVISSGRCDVDTKLHIKK